MTATTSPRGAPTYRSNYAGTLGSGFKGVARRLGRSRTTAHALVVCLLTLPLAAQTPATWTTPLTPFRIAGNLYYVGSEDLAAYLVATPKGNILINANLESSPPQIAASIRSLGFNYGDTKILLISHAHHDHCGGAARIKRETGAKYEVMAEDVPVVEAGGRNDFHYANDTSMWFPPTRVDRVLHDGDTVSLEGTTLTAHLTAGHTKGTTTWTFDVEEGGRTLHVVVVGGPNVNPGERLVHNTTYPQISADFRHEFRMLKSLPCDIFLGAHGSYFGLPQKLARFKHGQRDAFIDSDGYKAYVADRERAFEAELRTDSVSKR